MPGNHDSLLEWPVPAGLFRQVDPALVGVVTAGDLPVEQRLSDMSRRFLEPRHPVDGVNRKAKAVRLIANREFQGCIDIALFLIAADVKMMLVSNYPDAQAAAVEAGALPGFGKRDIGSPRVKELLRQALTEDVPAK